jgi:CheY-like chemotaxis protein
MRALAGMQDALLICITGHGSQAHRQLSFDAGCRYHLLKPIDWSKLVPLLDQLRAATPGERQSP